MAGSLQPEAVLFSYSDCVLLSFSSPGIMTPRWLSILTAQHHTRHDATSNATKPTTPEAIAAAFATSASLLDEDQEESSNGVPVGANLVGAGGVVEQGDLTSNVAQNLKAQPPQVGSRWMQAESFD